ncbi:MAG TPA: cupin domain-containing protein [Anaerolineales bacterium]|nr:cupin domain-containing protein [Anaerolineales bacterium]
MTSPSTPTAKILELNGMINYQEGSIVSRVILKSSNGNVTLFAFDTSQELSEHSAPYDALVEVTEGEAEIKISGIPSMVKAGEAIIMPADEPHAVKATSRFKMLLTMLK